MLQDRPEGTNPKRTKRKENQDDTIASNMMKLQQEMSRPPPQKKINQMYKAQKHQQQIPDNPTPLQKAVLQAYFTSSDSSQDIYKKIKPVETEAEAAKHEIANSE